MKTNFITSRDGKQIAYDVVGDGPALMLLHGGGGGQSRQDWHEIGYVERLKEDFTVMTMDIRGHGESDKPTDPADYRIDIMCQDILDVAAACGVGAFAIWGFSYGGNIARFLAAQSQRITGLIIMGIPLGLAVPAGYFRDFVDEFRAHWRPIVQAQVAGTLDLATLPEEDRQELEEIDIPVLLAWLTAMLDWGSIEPADLPCPTMWLAGTENEGTMASIRAYEGALAGSNVQVRVMEGLNHAQEFEEIDQVLPAMLDFTNAI